MPQRGGLGADLGGVLPLIKEVKLLAQVIQQLSPCADIGLWHKTQGTFVLGRSFAACAQCSGTSPRARRVGEDQLGISRALSVEGQPRVVIAAGGEQHLDDLGVNGRLSVRGNRSLDRHPRYLMAESKIIPVLDQ